MPIPEQQKAKPLFKEIEDLLNRYSEESKSNTPDWILAQYLMSVLRAFNYAVNQREAWYGRKDIQYRAFLEDFNSELQQVDNGNVERKKEED